MHKDILKRMCLGYRHLFMGCLWFVAILLFFAESHAAFWLSDTLIVCSVLMLVSVGLLMTWFWKEGFDFLMMSSWNVIPIAIYGILLMPVDFMKMYALVGSEEQQSDYVFETLYHRDSELVGTIEASKTERYRSSVLIGYRYSPRTAMMMGSSLHIAANELDLPSQDEGLAAWLFGIRAAFELSAYFALYFTPVFIVYGLYRHLRSAGPKDSVNEKPVRSLVLLIPFGMGLIPMLVAL